MDSYVRFFLTQIRKTNPTPENLTQQTALWNSKNIHCKRMVMVDSPMLPTFTANSEPINQNRKPTASMVLGKEEKKLQKVTKETESTIMLHVQLIMSLVRFLTCVRPEELMVVRLDCPMEALQMLHTRKVWFFRETWNLLMFYLCLILIVTWFLFHNCWLLQIVSSNSLKDCVCYRIAERGRWLEQVNKMMDFSFFGVFQR